MPPTNSNERARFGLRGIFATTTALAVVLAVAVQIPSAAFQQAIRTAPYLFVFSALLALIPLTCVSLVGVAISCVLPAARLSPERGGRFLLWAPHRFVWQFGKTEPPTWTVSLIIAFTCTVVTSLLWALLRELGLTVSLTLSEGLSAGKHEFQLIPLFRGRLTQWEFYAILRWWCFFGLLTAVWLVVAWPLRYRWNLEPMSACVRRLLAFAPWLVVLEIAFLIGIWTRSANVVPEPSTLFAEGIFSWNLWHWDCWKGADWINRGMVPTFAIATLFYSYALRWRWAPAIAAAACSVPLALMLSVAWSLLIAQLIL